MYYIHECMFPVITYNTLMKSLYGNRIDGAVVSPKTSFVYLHACSTFCIVPGMLCQHVELM